LTNSQLQNYAKGLAVDVSKGAERDCDALVDYVNAASMGRTAAQLNSSMGIFVQQDLKTTLAGIPSNPGSVNFTGSSSSFLPQYQNSNGDTSNQTHHFAAFFEFGFQYGVNSAAALGQLYETVEGVTDKLGYNQGDVNLAVAAASLGQQLANGTITPDALGTVIQDTICNP
jgi:hypothetical protein